MKLMRKLKGRDVQLTHGFNRLRLNNSIRETPEFKQTVIKFLDDLVSHYVFDEEGNSSWRTPSMREGDAGTRGSGKVRDFALLWRHPPGRRTNTDSQCVTAGRLSIIVARRWWVLWSIHLLPRPEWLNRTINMECGMRVRRKIDCPFRYPERELMSVSALRTYGYYGVSQAVLVPQEEMAPALTAQQQLDDLLDIPGMSSASGSLTRACTATSRFEKRMRSPALEVMSRFAN